MGSSEASKHWYVVEVEIVNKKKDAYLNLLDYLYFLIMFDNEVAMVFQTEMLSVADLVGNYW